MNKIRIKIFSTLLFLFFGSALAGDPDSTALMTVIAENDSLVVLLDNKVVGKTPIVNLEIPSGAHELVVHSPQWPSWSQQDYWNSFVALAGNSYEFKPEFRSIVTINSIPFGANVVENGSLLGKTPCQVPFGDYQQVKLELEGYKTQTVDLDKITNFFHLATLAPKEEWLISKVKERHERQHDLRSNRSMLFASLGFATAAGLATLHFRDRGNEEYAAYMATAVPAKMEDHYSSSEYYDQLANISYALFELGFVLTGYFFLTSRE